jgi:hypothetical protein
MPSGCMHSWVVLMPGYRRDILRKALRSKLTQPHCYESVYKDGLWSWEVIL